MVKLLGVPFSILILFCFTNIVIFSHKIRSKKFHRQKVRPNVHLVFSEELPVTRVPFAVRILYAGFIGCTYCVKCFSF